MHVHMWICVWVYVCGVCVYVYVCVYQYNTILGHMVKLCVCVCERCMFKCVYVFGCMYMVYVYLCMCVYIDIILYYDIW